MCVVSIACISYNDAYAKLIRQISTSSKFHSIIKEITFKYNKLFIMFMEFGDWCVDMNHLMMCVWYQYFESFY